MGSGRAEAVEQEGDVIHGSTEEESGGTTVPGPQEDEGKEPQSKRMRTQTLSVVCVEAQKSVSWADLMDAEECE